MSVQLLDTHAHLISDDWQAYPPKAMMPGIPKPDPCEYSVTADALIGMMDANGVTNACLVQRGHVYGTDNSLILDAARAYPDRFHPVVILDTQDPQTPGRYREMVRSSHACGFRMANMRPWFLDTAWMSSQPAMEVWKTCADLGTPMNLIFFMKQLPYLLPLLKIIAREFPDLQIILDHGAMPYGMTQYEVGLAEQAGEPINMPPAPHFGLDETICIFEDVPNVHFKITEINMERMVRAGVRSAHLIRRMVDSFGEDRLIWGSDIGQSMLWNYEQKVAMVMAATDFLTKDEARKFLHDNAARIYGIG